MMASTAAAITTTKDKTTPATIPPALDPLELV